jgi:ABC-type transporter Mla maintaining outer membrane lipid asymmetry ATPase subunit MlaF
VAFDVRAQTACCILGGSGSGTGKSVTLKVLIGLLKFSEGWSGIQDDLSQINVTVGFSVR